MSETEIHGDLDGVLSNLLRQIRRRQALAYVRNAKRILDVGCGICLWEKEIAPTQYYLGLDADYEIVQQNLQTDSLTFQTFNFETDDIHLLPQSFDLVIMLAVVEHFEDPAQILTAVSELMAPGGEVVLTTPAPGAEKVLDIGAKIRLFARDKHQHHDLLDQSALETCAAAANLHFTVFHRFLFGQNQFAVFRKD